MNLSTLAALMSINASNAARRITKEYDDHKKPIQNNGQYDQYENDKKELEKQAYKDLLLKGETKTMVLTETETIKISKIIYDEYGNWMVRSSREEIVFEDIEKSIQYLIEFYKAKEFQLIPYKVDRNFVDIFMLVMKVDKK